MKNKLSLIIALLFASANDTHALPTDNTLFYIIGGIVTSAGRMLYQSYYYTTTIKKFNTIVDEASMPTKGNDEAEIATLTAHHNHTKEALANAQKSNLLIELLGKDEKTFIADKLNEITQCVKEASEPWEKAKAVNNCFDELCQKWKKTNPEKDCINILCKKN